MPKRQSTHTRIGAQAELIRLVADGEWHGFEEAVEALRPYVNRPSHEAFSSIISGINCERMGIRGRGDQSIRWRPDLFLANEPSHERSSFKAGAEVVLKGLLGLRTFQQLLVQPGQQLNPTQRYWIDQALAFHAGNTIEELA